MCSVLKSSWFEHIRWSVLRSTSKDWIYTCLQAVNVFYLPFPLSFPPFWNSSTGNKLSMVPQGIHSYSPPGNQTGSRRDAVLLMNMPQCKPFTLQLHKLGRCLTAPGSILPQPPVCGMPSWERITELTVYFQLSRTAYQMFPVHWICHTADKLISLCETTGGKIKDSTFDP